MSIVDRELKRVAYYRGRIYTVQGDKVAIVPIDITSKPPVYILRIPPTCVEHVVGNVTVYLCGEYTITIREVEDGLYNVEVYTLGG